MPVEMRDVAPGLWLWRQPHPDWREGLEAYLETIEREFPEVRQVVEEMYGQFANTNAAADAAFERDVVWPPGTFWERFETGRAAASEPMAERDGRTGRARLRVARRPPPPAILSPPAPPR